MDAQQETSRVLNLTQLDLILSFLPDAGGAKILRDQLVSACRMVEAKENEAQASHERAESQSNLLRDQLEELKTEREEFQKQKSLETEKLKDEQAKLKALAETLGSQFQHLSTNAGKVTERVSDWQKTVAEKLHGFEEAISHRASGREENVNLLNKRVEDLLNSTKQNTKDLSSMRDKSDEMATAVDFVKEDQKRIESSLKNGVTMEGMTEQIEPLVELANAIKKVVEEQPTVQFLDTKFAEVGRLAEQLQQAYAQVNELTQENQTLRNANETLNTEVGHARDFKAQAKDAFDDFEDRVKDKDSKIEELQGARNDLHNQLMEANSQISQGQDASRELQRVQRSLRTAEADCRELASVKARLQQAEQTEQRLAQKVTELKHSLGGEKKAHDVCSSKLTEALTSLRDVNRQKEKLEDDILQVRNELRELRSQQNLDLQKQMKDQWDTVSKAMKEQLSEKHSHEETVRQLKGSWSSEKEALQGQISAKVSLIGNLEQEIQTLQSRVSTLEPLQSELNTANGNISRMSLDLEEAKLNLRDSEARVTELEEEVIVSGTELDHLEAENGRLKGSSESVLQQLQGSEGTVKRLQQECQNLHGELSSLKAQSVVIPEGVTGELSRIYYRAADQLCNIPIVLDTTGELEMQQLAAELITLIDGYKWKENLLEFLRSRSEGWFCLQQVMAGDNDLVANGGKCQYHDDCLSVKVVFLNGSPTLKFIFSD
ncbi:hypothetical protein FPRO05_10730 [Fusarium proliferatum]|uniref:Uncharacterized protein n=1 Tax=Gibberella intermedia TaxID=948311 RepID=A0A365NC95_GIBIN|nr:hypothetical protein FPRO05_10730 [Fusarium proliferatum]